MEYRINKVVNGEMVYGAWTQYIYRIAIHEINECMAANQEFSVEFRRV